MADTTAIAAEHAAGPAKPRLSTDARWIVATGVAIALLLVTLDSMMIQQNAMLMQQYATINARIDDTNRSTNERFNDQNRRIDEMQTDIREIRGLLLQLLERTAPAD